MMTKFKVVLVGEEVLLPEWIKNLDVDEEYTKELYNGFVAHEYIGYYDNIQELIQELKKLIRQNDIFEVTSLGFQDRKCSIAKWIWYDTLRDPMGLWEEVLRD